MRSRRRTLSLSVDGTGEIVVRAPNNMRLSDIEQFVSSHADWIAQRRASIERARPDLSDGAVISLCGVSCTIAQGRRARLEGDVLFLPSSERERAFVSFLRRLTRTRMAAYVEEYAARYGFSYSAVRVSSARGRWGSCSEKGNISFSFRTAFLSEEEARYLAVHELCHTRRMDHSPAFWKEVGAILPDFLRIRKGLRKKGAYMAFL